MKIHTLHRLPLYLQYLTSLSPRPSTISATAIAAALGLGDVTVRKDLTQVSDGGKPKIGYECTALIASLRHALGYDRQNAAALVGAGQLGRAIAHCQPLRSCGLRIEAVFDTDPERIGQQVAGVPILSISKIANLCDRLNIHIGILAVPPDQAQSVCREMLYGGVQAIWNFSGQALSVPSHVSVIDEDWVASFTTLSHTIADH